MIRLPRYLQSQADEFAYQSRVNPLTPEQVERLTGVPEEEQDEWYPEGETTHRFRGFEIVTSYRGDTGYWSAWVYGAGNIGGGGYSQEEALEAAKKVLTEGPLYWSTEIPFPEGAKLPPNTVRGMRPRGW